MTIRTCFIAVNLVGRRVPLATEAAGEVAAAGSERSQGQDPGRRLGHHNLGNTQAGGGGHWAQGRGDWQSDSWDRDGLAAVQAALTGEPLWFSITILAFSLLFRLKWMV